MQQSLNNQWAAHALLLIKRFPARTCWQLLPSFLSGLTFSRIYLLMHQADQPAYIGAFLLLAIVLLCLVTIIIYYRESRLELDSMQYLFIAGFPRRSVATIIFAKWMCLTMAGLVLAMGYLLLFPGETTTVKWSQIPDIIIGFGLLLLFFGSVLGTAVINHALRKWTIN